MAVTAVSVFIAFFLKDRCVARAVPCKGRGQRAAHCTRFTNCETGGGRPADGLRAATKDLPDPIIVRKKDNLDPATETVMLNVGGYAIGVNDLMSHK